MIERMFALQMEGAVSLRRWSAVLSAWNVSLCEISRLAGGKHVLSISIDGLTYGAAIAEVSVAFDVESAAVEFTKVHDSFGRGIRDGNLDDLPVALQHCGKKLLKAARIGGGDGFILSSETGDYAIPPHSKRVESDSPRPVPDQVVAYGAVSGRLQSLSSRGALRAVVFEELDDRPVRILLPAHQHERVRELWDQHVIVSGVVHRDPVTGRLLSISDIASIDPDPLKATGDKDPFAWTKARGALKHVHPELSSEELIRLVRDG